MVLKSRVLAPDWSAGNNTEREAKCRKHPLPTKNDPNAETDPFFYAEEEAAHICNGTFDDYVCPFREVCLHRALVNNEQAGTFGGLITEQRRWVRRQSRDPSLPTYIDRADWDISETWLHMVPDPEFFDESKEDNANAKPEEHSA